MEKKCQDLYNKWFQYCYNIDQKQDPYNICNKFLYDFSNCLLENIKK